MRSHSKFLLVVFTLVIISGFMTPGAANIIDSPGPISYFFEEVDTFTYRMSFRMADGAEAFLIRSRYWVSYLFIRHEPPIRFHYISADVAFYYGKTMLGRSLVQDVSVENAAFYPMWDDSGGYSHDLLNEAALVSVNGTIRDGLRLSNTMLIDDNALSRNLPMFGGHFVFEGLTFTLNDGSEFVVEEGELQIELKKQTNDIKLLTPTLSGSETQNYTSDSYTMIVNTAGLSPFIVLLDMFLAFTMIGTGSVIFVLLILHIKGKIKLPYAKVRGLLIRQTDATTSATRDK
ncbi:MAG: hypothetical protein ACXAEB_10030 [Candidatus Thorarchaeota archaeon]|jgi:hypothetical protein